MENQRTEYIQAKYERTETDKVNEMAIMSAALRHVEHARIKVPRTRDGHFHPQCLNVINKRKKALMAQ